MITTVLAFLLTLGVLIVVHEYGHYRVAVACGVKVLRFSIGFGRVLWRRQKSADATEFVLCALPLGGYVRMLDEREGHVPEHQRESAFNRKPLLQRVAIVAAGPIANLLLAVLLYACAHWLGVSEPKAVLGPPVVGSVADAAGMRSGDWVRAVSLDGSDWQEVRSLTDLRWQVTQVALDGGSLRLSVSDGDGRGNRDLKLDLSRLPSRDVDAAFMRAIGLGSGYSEPVLGDVKADGPAATAGLKRGDRVVALDGAAINDAQTLRERIRAAVRGSQSVDQMWSVLREGRALEIKVTPRATAEGSAMVGRIDAFVGAPPEMVKVGYGPIEGLHKAAVRTWEVSALTLRMLGRMLIGEASLKNLSGL